MNVQVKYFFRFHRCRLTEWFVDLEKDEPDESEMQALSLAHLLAKEMREMQEKNPLQMLMDNANGIMHNANNLLRTGSAHSATAVDA